jgi:hypothetical protein
MKAEPIIREVEAVKDRLAEHAGGDLQRFLDQMDGWLQAHPHTGPVVKSPGDLELRLRHREATEPPQPPPEPYRVYDPVIAEVHRIREKFSREGKNVPLVATNEGLEGSSALREEPNKTKK